MSGPKPYKLTLADLRRQCPLLDTVDVEGKDSKHEKLVGRRNGEIAVQTPVGPTTPARSKLFKDLYQHAVAAGIIKPRPIGKVDGPDDPPGHGDR